MSSKQLVRLAALLGAVLLLWGAVALASRRTGRSTERGAIIPKIDTSRVDTVAITGPGDPAIIARGRTGGGGWRVNGFQADTQAVAELLRGLVDREAAVELVARNPSSHARLKVTDDSGKRVRVVQQGRALMQLVAGKQTTDGEGIYVRRVGDSAVFALRGGLATALARPTDDWRDHTIARITPDSVGSIEVGRGSRSYTLRRKGGGWTFGTGAAADSAAVAGLLNQYRDIKAAGFGNKATEDSLRFERPRRTARLLDRRGTPLLILAFDSIASGIWVRAGKTGGAANPYRLDSWIADQLTPADSSLRKR